MRGPILAYVITIWCVTWKITNASSVDTFRKQEKKMRHYENKPIQIYTKFYQEKNDNFQIKILIFFIFLLKT